MLYIDLDGFKNINDTLGHTHGDQLLIAIAERITHSLRGTDTAARLGGDEFVVIMVDINHSEDAAQLARKLLDAIAAPVDLAGERLGISVSVGLSLYKKNQHTAID